MMKTHRRRTTTPENPGDVISHPTWAISSAT